MHGQSHPPRESQYLPGRNGCDYTGHDPHVDSCVPAFIYSFMCHRMASSLEQDRTQVSESPTDGTSGSYSVSKVLHPVCVCNESECERVR